MPTDHLEKEISKADMAKKVQAWQTINATLVKANSEFMNKLGSMLTEKTVQHEQLKEKLESPDADEESGAEYLFIGGYIQCLRDILGIKPKEV